MSYKIIQQFEHIFVHLGRKVEEEVEVLGREEEVEVLRSPELPLPNQGLPTQTLLLRSPELPLPNQNKILDLLISK